MNLLASLSEDQIKQLTELSERTGRKVADLVREAIDQFLALHEPLGQRPEFKQARGMWKDRTDLPDFEQLRPEADRQ